MFKKHIPLVITLSTSLLSAPAFAQTAAEAKQPMVLEIIDISGRSLIEMPNGQQRVAQKGVQLPDGAKLLVLEKGSATGRYLRNQCEVKYPQNTVVNVHNDAQCAAGVPVINANQYAKFGTGANDGCCVVRTITTPVIKPAAPTPLSATHVAGSTLTGTTTGTNYLPYIVGGAAGVILLANLLDDDDDPAVSP